MEKAEFYQQFVDFATEREKVAIDNLVAVGGNISACAEAMGVRRQTVQGLLKGAHQRAARAGWTVEEKHHVPPGYHVKGISTLYGEAGEVKGRWVKTVVDREDRVAELLRELPLALSDVGRAEAVPPPVFAEEDWLTVYPMGDPHIGMFSWAEETGHDFDLGIAERNLCAAVDQLVGLSRPSKRALLINVGDFFHADNSSNQTARSGHSLDVDTRYAKVLQVGIRLMRRCIDRALEKHEHVTVINEIGNHDDHSSLVLSIALAQFYENNPRVHIDTSPAAFHWYRFGKVLIGTTHGDQCKPDKLPGIMAVDRKKDWGETDFRYFYTGHIHHDSRKDFPGVTWESFRTMAARDAWHMRAGYRADRSMVSIEIHKDRGERRRCTVGIADVELAA